MDGYSASPGRHSRATVTARKVRTIVPVSPAEFEAFSRRPPCTLGRAGGYDDTFHKFHPSQGPAISPALQEPSGCRCSSRTRP